MALISLVHKGSGQCSMSAAAAGNALKILAVQALGLPKHVENSALTLKPEL